MLTDAAQARPEEEDALFLDPDMFAAALDAVGGEAVLSAAAAAAERQMGAAAARHHMQGQLWRALTGWIEATKRGPPRHRAAPLKGSDSRTDETEGRPAPATVDAAGLTEAVAAEAAARLAAATHQLDTVMVEVEGKLAALDPAGWAALQPELAALEATSRRRAVAGAAGGGGADLQLLASSGEAEDSADEICSCAGGDAACSNNGAVVRALPLECSSSSVSETYSEFMASDHSDFDADEDDDDDSELTAEQRGHAGPMEGFEYNTWGCEQLGHAHHAEAGDEPPYTMDDFLLEAKAAAQLRRRQQDSNAPPLTATQLRLLEERRAVAEEWRAWAQRKAAAVEEEEDHGQQDRDEETAVRGSGTPSSPGSPVAEVYEQFYSSSSEASRSSSGEETETDSEPLTARLARHGEPVLAPWQPAGRSCTQDPGRRELGEEQDQEEDLWSTTAASDGNGWFESISPAEQQQQRLCWEILDLERELMTASGSCSPPVSPTSPQTPQQLAPAPLRKEFRVAPDPALAQWC